jgi:hypothetical protein
MSMVRVDSSADILKLVLRHFKMLVGIEFVALDDVLARDLVAGLGIDFEVAYPVTGFLIYLVETDFLGFRCRRE